MRKITCYVAQPSGWQPQPSGEHDAAGDEAPKDAIVTAASRQRQLQWLARVEPSFAPSSAESQRKDRSQRNHRRREADMAGTQAAASAQMMPSDINKAARSAFNRYVIRFEGQLTDQIDGIKQDVAQSSDRTLAAIRNTTDSQLAIIEALVGVVKQQRAWLRVLAAFCVLNALLPGGWLLSLVEIVAWLLATTLRHAVGMIAI